MAADGDVEHVEIEMELEDPRIARSPREPTSLERTLHEVTHFPLRTSEGCRPRLAGGGRRCPVHRNGLYARVRAWHQVLGGRSCRVAMLVVKGFVHKFIWLYPVEGKGVTMAECLPGMVRVDVATCGMDNSMIIVKMDQELAIKEPQEETARQRRQAGALGTIREKS